MRKASGLSEIHLLRSDLEPNEIIIFFAAEDLNRARDFAASDDLRQVMQNAGVIDMPDIYFLTE